MASQIHIMVGAQKVSDSNFNLNSFLVNFYNLDDDARNRVLEHYPRIARQAPEIGRYFANCHEKQEKNPYRFMLFMTAASRMKTDGLNSMKYKVVKKEKNSLFTRIYVKYKNVKL